MKINIREKFKKKHVIIILLLLVAVVFLVSYESSKNAGQLTTKEKVDDFEYMYDVIKESYPFLEVNKRVNGVDWLANKDVYLERIKKTKNDKKFIYELNKILANLNNGHNHLLESSYDYNVFKETYGSFGWYDFFDDENVKKRYEGVKDTASNRNRKRISKNDLLLEDIVEGKIGYIYLPQMSLMVESAEDEMKIISEYIKTLKDHEAIVIDVRGNTGGDDRYWQ